jgi:hypothetical protein
MSLDTFLIPLVPLLPSTPVPLNDNTHEGVLPAVAWPVEGTRMWTTPNQPLSTPPDHLRAAHILIAFLAAAAETKQQDDDNRSIGRNYCIRTTADGPYVAVGIIACNNIVVVNISCTK